MLMLVNLNSEKYLLNTIFNGYDNKPTTIVIVNI